MLPGILLFLHFVPFPFPMHPNKFKTHHNIHFQVILSFVSYTWWPLQKQLQCRLINQTEVSIYLKSEQETIQIKMKVICDFCAIFTYSQFLHGQVSQHHHIGVPVHREALEVQQFVYIVRGRMANISGFLENMKAIQKLQIGPQ